jgi:hypothetical protein
MARRVQTAAGVAWERRQRFQPGPGVAAELRHVVAGWQASGWRHWVDWPSLCLGLLAGCEADVEGEMERVVRWLAARGVAAG